MPRPLALYQIDTRDWLWRCGHERGRPCALDQIPDEHLDRIAALGFDLVYLLGIWQTGPAGAAVSRNVAEWQAGFRAALPDMTPDDITGSPFAVSAYRVHEEFGGSYAFESLRDRLRQRGLGIILDFVPNHTAMDHYWVQEHPDYYLSGSAQQAADQPGVFAKIDVRGETHFLAHGKDPYFPAWPDTLQLNYANPDAHEAMVSELTRIAALCDGVRCDMSMLVLPEVFQKTWGLAMQPFWPAAVAACREVNPDFLLLAEVYWGLEGTLLSQGFDYAYDKSLYDRLVSRRAADVRQHLSAPVSYQSKTARFLENHDEARAAATLPREAHPAAAAITYLAPGMRFFQHGQLEGARVRPSVHLRRRAVEAPDAELAEFYDQLLSVMRSGAIDLDWRWIWPTAAWEVNDTFCDFVCFAWYSVQRPYLLVAVNYSDHQGQCYVPMRFGGLAGKTVRFVDLLGDDVYERRGDDLFSRGLYLDVPAWKVHAFRITF